MQYPRRNHAGGNGAFMDNGVGMMMGNDVSRLMVWDAARVLEDSLPDSSRIAEMIAQMEQVLERTRVTYNDALAERDAVRDQLVEAEGKLTEVQKAVQRYTTVQEPVVASDGFTYENAVIKKYLDECQESGTQAHSQQTREPLTNVLIPNQSLKKLVELLKSVTPQEVPPATVRPQLQPLTASSEPSQTQYNRTGVDWTGEVDDGTTAAVAVETKHAASSSAPSSPDSAAAASDNNAWRRPNANVSSAKPAGGSPTQPTRVVAKADSPITGPALVASGKLHPCMRVYGFCNFKEECQFAMFPFESCLNNIKGKCRFGTGYCKELHVNASDPKYVNPRSIGTNQASNNSSMTSQPGSK